MASSGITKITIRSATDNDAELIADLSRQTFYETFAADNTKENMDKFMNEQFTRERLIDEVGQPWHVFLLAFGDDEPIGYAKLREGSVPPGLLGRSCIEIARIYSVRKMIGKGVGQKIMQTCIDIGFEKRKEILWLGVWEKNKRAIDFYTRWGFEKFGEQKFLLGDDPQTDWLMKKELL